MFNLLICACWEQTLCVLRFGEQCLSGTSPQLTANTTVAFPGKPPLTPHDNVAQQSLCNRPFGGTQPADVQSLPTPEIGSTVYLCS